MGQGLGRQVVGLTLCVLAVAGCGSGSGGEVGAGTDPVVDEPATTTSSSSTTAPTSTTATDQFASATAGALLLAPADLGPGWAAAEPATPDTCGGKRIDEHPLVFTGPPDAAQATFADAQLRVVQTVVLQVDRRAAQSSVDAWVYRMELCERRGSNAGVDYAIEMGPASLGSYGEQSWTTRLTVPSPNEDLSGFEVVFRQGRAVVVLHVVGPPAALTLERAAELMGVVRSKLAQA